MRRKPGFKTYYTIGVIVDKRLPKNKTLRQIGAEFGLTYQNAYTACVVALGKLVYGLAHSVGEIPDL